MDFELAANRLKKDHAELRNKANRRPRALASTKATLEAKRRQEYRKKQLEKKKQKERVMKLKLDYVKRGFDRVEHKLGMMRNLGEDSHAASSGNNDGRIFLEATSVHGQGDKITLPSSLLSTLANKDLLRLSQERGQPLFFRLGIRNPNYIFPASESMKTFMDEYVVKDLKTFGNGDEISHDESVSMMDDDTTNYDGDEKAEEEKWEQAYLQELAHEYVSYVYATVIEFTQDEGYVGLPQCMATALLQPKTICETTETSVLLESKRTADPASASTTMEIDNDIDIDSHDESLESKTPGHPAYGLFPIPKSRIEVTLLTHLPLGSKCTLQPTKDAIQNGFYNLKDVKLALEQSLIRTRGCLNVNDIVHCWYRGKKFDLCVTDVTPSHVGAVSCVNTDVEVDIAAAKVGNDSIESNGNGNNTIAQNHEMDTSSAQSQSQSNQGNSKGGYRLSDDRSDASSPNKNVIQNDSSSICVRQFYDALKSTSLPDEPELDQTENVVTIQIRGYKGKQCRRRFDASSAQIGDLFVLAVHENIVDESTVSDRNITNGFRLVTRFPRRVFTLESDGETSLANASLSKQESFLVENM